MAKKEEKSKIVLEREYIIPLRREFQKAPSYKRAKKTIKALKEFLAKHMKSNNIKIGKYLNLKVWEHGIKNPPHKLKVKAEKYDDGLIKAELVGAPVEKPKEEKKQKKTTPEKEEKKHPEKKEEKTEEKKEKKQPEKKTEEKKEEKTETVKKEEPKETKSKEKKPAEDKKAVKEEKKSSN